MSAKPKKERRIDFIVTTSNDADNAANKRRVRSVAALKSWPERRKKTFESLEAAGGQTTFVVNELEPESATKRTKPSKQRTARLPKAKSISPQESPEALLSPSSVGSTSETASSASSSSTRPSSVQSRSPIQEIPDNHISNSETPCKCSKCRLRRQKADNTQDSAVAKQSIVPARKKRMADGLEKPLFMDDLAMMTACSAPELSPSNTRADPFNGYPVPFQPWFDSILHHMLVIYGPRGWPALDITHEQGVRWEWFMTQKSLTDPALFYVRLLFGSGDLIRLGQMGPQVMYWLREQAIKAINEALRDPERATSDALILAVGRIAIYESFYGDKVAAYTIHRPAQKRMIDMRGGMEMLEVPELIKRMICWSDRAMALRSGTQRMFEDDSDFSLNQSVKALEKWAPSEDRGSEDQVVIQELSKDADGD